MPTTPPNPPASPPRKSGFQPGERSVSGRVTVAVFAKHWTPGATKTRLAESIGNERAARIAKAFLEATLARLTNLPVLASAPAVDRVIAATPTSQRSAFEELPAVREGGWQVADQAAGDLGTRMRSLCEQVDGPALLLGADSPHLPLASVADAIGWLANASARRLILGPSTDGGYWLLGQAGETAPIYDEMPWSTPQLFQLSIDRLTSAGWREGVDYRLAPEWYDIDDLADLDRMRRYLIAGDPSPVGTDLPLRQLREQLDELLGPLTDAPGSRSTP